jgi:hypothetical protein
MAIPMVDLRRDQLEVDEGRREEGAGSRSRASNSGDIAMDAAPGSGTTRHACLSHASTRPIPSLPPARQKSALVQLTSCTPPPFVYGIGTLVQWVPFHTSASWAPCGKHPGAPGTLQSGDSPTPMQRLAEAQLTPSSGTSNLWLAATRHVASLRSRSPAQAILARQLYRTSAWGSSRH